MNIRFEYNVSGKTENVIHINEGFPFFFFFTYGPMKSVVFIPKFSYVFSGLLFNGEIKCY